MSINSSMKLKEKKERGKERKKDRQGEKERKKGGRKEGRGGGREGGSHQKKKSNGDISAGVHMGSISLPGFQVNSLPTTWVISYLHLNMDGKVNWRGGYMSYNLP